MKKSIIISLFILLILSIPVALFSQFWSSVGDFLPTGSSPEQMIDFEGDIVVCGDFDTVNGEDFGGIVRWDGNSWTQMGQGITGDFDCIGVANGELFVGGVLNGSGGGYQQAIYRWSGTEWIGTGNATEVGYPHAMAEWNGQLIVSVLGSGVETNKILRYEGGTTWTQVGPDISDVGIYYKRVVAIAVYNDTIFVAGAFDNVGPQGNAQRIAKFNGENWVSVNFPMSELENNGEVKVLKVHDGKLFVGGELFNYELDQSNIPSIVSFDGSTWTPYTMDETYNSFIYSLFSDGEHLYCGGSFLYYDQGELTSGVVVFDEDDENDFINLSFYNEIQPFVEVTNLIMVDESLYAGGQFFAAGNSTNANGIAQFDGVIPEPTAIDELISESLLSVYPNPVATNLTIAAVPNGTVQIHNLIGELVYKGFVNNTFSLNVSEWETGIYLVSVVSEKTRSVVKVAVK